MTPSPYGSPTWAVRVPPNETTEKPIMNPTTPAQGITVCAVCGAHRPTITLTDEQFKNIVLVPRAVLREAFLLALQQLSCRGAPEAALMVDTRTKVARVVTGAPARYLNDGGEDDPRWVWYIVANGQTPLDAMEYDDADAADPEGSMERALASEIEWENDHQGMAFVLIEGHGPEGYDYAAYARAVADYLAAHPAHERCLYCGEPLGEDGDTFCEPFAAGSFVSECQRRYNAPWEAV